MAAKLGRIEREVVELAELVEPPPRTPDAEPREPGARMSELLSLGISHKTAPLALRERLALTRGRASARVPRRAAPSRRRSTRRS